ncbi:hypothetical protein LOZ57_006736 [Ophidiomyces ophidiicola]|uniref:uncharacterized protein n=1 Tax=Ophidiomyces ophidiicola TaxID=1387563 RepID=UPI0020C2519C|nr:uncharacterized protein LOZ57_006736 [Ophidiomyces ophidiicola]KAI1936669.1 hypothetical protein LOZ57_006736 [Ophidiomyces ophidiicola]
MVERSTNLDSRNYFLLTISAKTFCNNMSLQFSDVYVKAKNFQNSLVLLAEYFEFTCTKKLQEFLTQELMASILSPFKTLHAKSFELKGVNNEKKKTKTWNSKTRISDYYTNNEDTSLPILTMVKTSADEHLQELACILIDSIIELDTNSDDEDEDVDSSYIIDTQFASETLDLLFSSFGSHFRASLIAELILTAEDHSFSEIDQSITDVQKIISVAA